MINKNCRKFALSSSSLLEKIKFYLILNVKMKMWQQTWSFRDYLSLWNHNRLIMLMLWFLLYCRRQTTNEIIYLQNSSSDNLTTMIISSACTLSVKRLKSAFLSIYNVIIAMIFLLFLAEHISGTTWVELCLLLS